MVAGLLFGAACDRLPLERSPQVIYLVPENFSGWVCVDFDIKGGSPLPREGQAVVVRVKPGAILQTSDSKEGVALVFPVAAYEEVAGSRRPLSNERSIRREVSRSGPNEPTTRTCRFIGTVDQLDAAGDPPGFDGRFPGGPVSAAERTALIALFEATEGPKWKHRTGWLGSPGTECSWHGIQCGQGDGGESTVIWLDLTENNLRGAIPETFGGLEHLESLDLYGNQLTGTLPGPLIRRWASGELRMSALQASWLTDVSEVSLEYSSTGSLGAWHRIILTVDGRAKMFAERLRNRWPLDRATYCEVKDGWIPQDDFARLAHLIERSGYYALKPEYDRLVTHAAFETTKVIRNGKAHTISDYAAAGPLELWAIRQAIAGVAGTARWEKVERQGNCPAPLSR